MQPSPPPAAVHPTHSSVHSADGARIGYLRLGSGPAIVFVHGSLADHTSWMAVARLLAHRYTCYLMDRRGRGTSDPFPAPDPGPAPYSMEREYDDILAVLRAAGSENAPVAGLVGHSYGAIGCLGAALRHPVPRLVLYEPPLPVGGLAAPEHVAQYAAAVAAGDPDRAVEIGMTHFVRLPAAAVEAMRTTRGWKQMVRLAATWIPELEAIRAIPATVEPYRALACPSMLLTGESSSLYPLRRASEALAEVLPGVRVELLQGQGHAGLRTAPELVARLIDDFLSP